MEGCCGGGFYRLCCSFSFFSFTCSSSGFASRLSGLCCFVSAVVLFVFVGSTLFPVSNGDGDPVLHLRQLLLRAGDVEPNPGPRCGECQLECRRGYQPLSCRSCGVQVHKRCTGLSRYGADKAAEDGSWRCNRCMRIMEQERREARLEEEEERTGGQEATGRVDQHQGQLECKRCKGRFRAGCQPVVCERCGGRVHKKCLGTSRYRADVVARTGRWQCG